MNKTEIKRMIEETLEDQKKVNAIFDRLTNARGIEEQKKAIFELSREVMAQNEKLWNENVALKTRLLQISHN